MPYAGSDYYSERASAFEDRDFASVADRQTFNLDPDAAGQREHIAVRRTFDAYGAEAEEERMALEQEHAPRRSRIPGDVRASKMQAIRDVLDEQTDRGARAIEKAILVLYARQTADEQRTESTNHHNGMGFTGADAPFLSSLAKWINTSRRAPGQRLTPRQRERARRQLRKYAAQLARVALERN